MARDGRSPLPDFLAGSALLVASIYAMTIEGLVVTGLAGAMAGVFLMWAPVRLARRRRRRDPSLLVGETVFETDLDGYAAKAVRLGDRVTVVVDGVTRDLSLFPRTRRGGDFRTGDPAFDARFVVEAEADPLRVQSLLDAKARESCLATLTGYPGLTLEDGRIVWSGRISDSLSEHVTRELVRLAASLEGPDARARLEESASRDPVASVRLRSLDLLLRRFAGSEEATRAAAAALLDADPSMRLRGALYPALADSEVAIQVLVELARGAKTPAAVRAQALAAAATSLPRGRAGELALEISIGAHYESAVREQALGLVGALAPANAVAELVRGLGRFPGVRAAIATALGQLGDRDAEPGLLRLLDLADASAKRAAIVALGRVGTAASVEKLHAIGGRDADSAVASIHARLIGAGAGQLSVAGADAAGRLSTPDAEAGRVSMAMAKPAPASRSSR